MGFIAYVRHQEAPEAQITDEMDNSPEIIEKCPVEAKNEVVLDENLPKISPSEKNIKNLSSDAFYAYFAKYGYHFSPKLAEFASSQMVNADGTDHTWNEYQVAGAMRAIGVDIPCSCTISDLTYLANMAYADFYPSVLREDVLCLRYAAAVANDPDGYEGMAFYRYLADLMATDTDIDFSMYM